MLFFPVHNFNDSDVNTSTQFTTQHGNKPVILVS